MRKLVVFVALLFSIATVSSVTTAPTASADGGLESSFVASINNYRAQQGLPALQVSGSLSAFARDWAATMASAGDIWHNPNLRSAPVSGWKTLGENVGVGYGVGDLMPAFIASPAHERNLSDARFNLVGVGVVTGADGMIYTAHVFAQAGAAPAAAAAPAPEPAAEAPAPTRTTAPARKAAAPQAAAAAAPAPEPEPAPEPAPTPTPTASADRIRAELESLAAAA